MSGIAHTIGDKEWINASIPYNPRSTILLSVPIHGTHPYERFGKQVIRDIYNDKRISYSVKYGTELLPGLFDDRLYVHHRSDQPGGRAR